MIFIPNMDVNSKNQTRFATEINNKGFTLMTSALTYINSMKFVKHMNETFGDNAEIEEVLIKFEDII